MRSLNILEDLVAIASYVTDSCNERAVAEYLEEFIKRFCPGLKLTRQYIGDNRWNLLSGNLVNPRIVFVCHMDTVMPSGDMKNSLVPSIRGGYLYGLGAADMKGGLYALLMAMQEVGATTNAAFIFDCDEEYYFLGAQKFLQQYRWNPQLVICPEPTDMRIVNGCRGIIELSFDVLGKSAHAGSPLEGINAIEQAVIIANRLKNAVLKYDNKYLGKTTVNLSRLDGGKSQGGRIVTQGNAVPDIARVLLDVRPSSDKLSGKRISEMLLSISKSCGVQLKNLLVTIDYPAYFSDVANSNLSIDRYIGKQYREDLGKGGFYEAALFARAWSCSAISFGPGDASSSHSANERVSIKDLQRTRSVFESLLNQFGN